MKGRHHEIIFYYIMEHLKTMTTNERIPLFIEMFAVVFDVDYTNLSILFTQYLPKIKPSIKEVALMARDLGITVRRFPIKENYGYTLIRKNRDVELMPRVLNEGLLETMIAFNKKYIKMSERHPLFFKEMYNDPS